MNKEKKQVLSRVEILINYFSLILIGIISYSYNGEVLWSDNSRTIMYILFLGIYGITFYRVHLKTGLYNLTRSKVEKLDERETQLIFKAFRRSYPILAILFFSFGFVVYNTYYGSFNMFFDFQELIVGIKTYFFVAFMFSITLPSSIIVWTKREV